MARTQTSMERNKDYMKCFFFSGKVEKTVPEEKLENCKPLKIYLPRKELRVNRKVIVIHFLL